MTQPLPEGFQPRQPGETAYAYRNRLSIARYGKTTYQRRVENAMDRGLSRTEARGHGPSTSALTEYQKRRQRTEQQYGPGVTPYDVWRAYTINDLISAGYTPETTGLSWNQLLTIKSKLWQINEWASDDVGLSPELLLDGVESEQEGYVEPGWTFENIQERYAAMYEYKVLGSKDYGRARFFRGTQTYVVPIQWWYYH
jgi:hypothetical protein